LKELKEKRLAKGLSQAKIARIVGVSQVAINYLESGQRKPSVDLAKKLGKALGIKWTKFFEEEKE
jgi:putative transcriptional regulator